MQTVKMRNPRRRKTTTTKRRRNTTTVANPRKRAIRRKRNPNTALIPKGMQLIASNPKRKKATRRRNGISRRNGIFSGLSGTLKTVALGGAGAIGTGIVSRGVMSAIGGVTAKVPIPSYVVQSALEIGIALVPVKMLAEKILSNENASKVVAGALIKAGLTFANGALPGVADYNPLGNDQRILSSSDGTLQDGIDTTDVLAGADGWSDEYEDMNQAHW